MTERENTMLIDLNSTEPAAANGATVVVTPLLSKAVHDLPILGVLWDKCIWHIIVVLICEFWNSNRTSTS